MGRLAVWCLAVSVGSLRIAPAGAATVSGPDARAWSAWGTATLDAASAAGKPLLVLVNDGSCGRCLGLEANALYGDDTAELIALHFVAVRVDRVERPELAEALAQAAILLTESDGVGTRWPLVLTATPEGRPFWAALVKPGAVSLQTVLGRLASDFYSDRAAVETRAGIVLANLREQQRRATQGDPTPARLEQVLERLRRARDPRIGGVLPEPERPSYGALRLLLTEHRRTGNAAALDLAARMLAVRGQAIARGLPPANLAEAGLLLRALAQATAAGRPELRAAAVSTADWAVKQLLDRDGGFVAARIEPLDQEEPRRDERVVAAWNGLMIGGLAQSGLLLDRPGDIDSARRAAERILARLGPATQLRRWALGETVQGSAVLEDYVYLAEGLLDLHQATQHARWRSEAQALVEAAVVRFADSEHGGFFWSDAAHEPLPARLRDGFDSALPSANGVLASVLVRLGRLTGESRFTDLGRRTIATFAGDLDGAPGGMETMASALAELVGAPKPQPSAEPTRPVRVVQGPVTAELRLASDDTRPGEIVDLRIRLTIADGWAVVAHQAGVSDLVPLSVSFPGDLRPAGRVVYPPGTSVRGSFGGRSLGLFHIGQAEVVVPFRAPETAIRVRVQVRFQPCDTQKCQAPESLLLEVAIAPGRP